MKILLLEDDKHLCANLKKQLEKQNYIVDACNDGEEGLYLALNQNYDLAIVDRMIPVIDGLTIIKAMRNKKIKIPVIIITGLSDLHDKIEGLDNGADDYLTKPFHIDELLARIRALIRRPAIFENQTSLSFHDITLDFSKRQLECKNNHLALTPTEFHLLTVFLEQPKTLLKRELLIQKVWETDNPIEIGNLDNYIYFLRKRLRTIESECVLSSVYGTGFILDVKQADD